MIMPRPQQLSPLLITPQPLLSSLQQSVLVTQPLGQSSVAHITDRGHAEYTNTKSTLKHNLLGVVSLRHPPLPPPSPPKKLLSTITILHVLEFVKN